MIITSRQNGYVSLACKLGEKKHRQSEKMFRFDGVKLFCEAVQRGVELSFVLVDQTLADSVNAKAKSLYALTLDDANCRILYLSHDLFVKISDENAPEGIICVAKYIDKIHKNATMDCREIAPDCRILLCESLRDPGNVGTVVRTAHAFGIDLLVFSDCAFTIIQGFNCFPCFHHFSLR
jgi:TrmH family RNA methyltransferase